MNLLLPESAFICAICGILLLNPLHRLLRQFVERGHAKFQVFFLRVLDLVVADAVQALHEHHHGRHAGARDFGGVVQRAARQAMRFAAGFADGVVAQRDEFVVERARVDLPEAFPRDCHVAFLRESFAGVFALPATSARARPRRDGADRA